MANIRFYAAALVIMAVIIHFGSLLIRHGAGITFMNSLSSQAEKNAEHIADTTLSVYEKKPHTFPDERRELTTEDMSSITVDGIKLDFPIRIGELPENFICYGMGMHESKEPMGNYKYGCSGVLLYNGQKIASTGLISEKADFDDDTLICNLVFTEGISRYMPQITVADIDVEIADIHEINRVFGADSDIFGYEKFVRTDGNKEYILNLSDNRVFNISYKELGADDKISEQDIVFYNKFPFEISLPENYSLENDEVNNALEYKDIPVCNEQMKAALDNMRIGDIHVQLPCTLNALMRTLGVEKAAMRDHSKLYFHEYGVVIVEGSIDHNDYGKINFKIAFRSEKELGDAQVIYLNSEYLNYDNIEATYIMDNILDEFNADHIYSFKHSSEDDIYYLTDYKFNNVEITEFREDNEISYWPENTERR